MSDEPERTACPRCAELRGRSISMHTVSVGAVRTAYECPSCDYVITLAPGGMRELHDQMRRRWFQPDNYDRLVERERDDPAVRSLIMALAQCYSIDEAMRTMVEVIIQMSLANAHMQSWRLMPWQGNLRALFPPRTRSAEHDRH